MQGPIIYHIVVIILAKTGTVIRPLARLIVNTSLIIPMYLAQVKDYSPCLPRGDTTEQECLSYYITLNRLLLVAVFSSSVALYVHPTSSLYFQ